MDKAKKVSILCSPFLKTYGEQKWLLLVNNPEQASIFVSTAGIAPT